MTPTPTPARRRRRRCTESESYQPRWLAFCHAHGRTPEEVRGPHWCAAYIIWVGRQWAEWRRLRGLRPDEPLYPAHHEDFDAWLCVPTQLGLGLEDSGRPPYGNEPSPYGETPVSAP